MTLSTPVVPYSWQAEWLNMSFYMYYLIYFLHYSCKLHIYFLSLYKLRKVNGCVVIWTENILIMWMNCWQASAIQSVVSHLSQSIMLQTKLVRFCHNTCSAFSLCCWTLEKYHKNNFRCQWSKEIIFMFCAIHVLTQMCLSFKLHLHHNGCDPFDLRFQ